VGIIESNLYSEAFDSPGNKAFLKLFHDKYPGRAVSTDWATGYSAAQVLEAVLKQINGNIEDKQAFLDGLYKFNVQSAKGPLKLDQYHDVIQNVYINKTVAQGSGYGQELLNTYQNVGQSWTYSPAQFARLQIGKMKGKWTGMTQAQLQQIASG
jgi:branched-chain amino acid transport system substrate-binding protein